MRKITYGAACSLDGYLARTDDRVDWLRWSEDVQRITAEYWPRVDVVLMGRKTYEVARAAGSGAYSGVTNYVLSSTLHDDPEPSVHLVRDEAAAFVRELKNQAGGEICLMGGGELAQSLFDAGLIDEVGVNIHPVLLGSGKPLFRPLRSQHTLELIKTELLSGGCIYALYRVVANRA
ncbi:MAG: dihydrofolate reductase family protein [Longimicrobiales bacterium]